jgi:hypothetical protein
MKTSHPARSLATSPAPSAILSALPAIPQPLILDAAQIDWPNLKRQKTSLYRIIITKTDGLSPSEIDDLEGVLSFLDHVEDKHLEL